MNVSAYRSIGTEFLNLGTLHISSWMLFVAGGCLMNFRVFSSIHGLYHRMPIIPAPPPVLTEMSPFIAHVFWGAKSHQVRTAELGGKPNASWLSFLLLVLGCHPASPNQLRLQSCSQLRFNSCSTLPLSLSSVPGILSFNQNKMKLLSHCFPERQNSCWLLSHC